MPLPLLGILFGAAGAKALETKPKKTRQIAVKGRDGKDGKPGKPHVRNLKIK